MWHITCISVIVYQQENGYIQIYFSTKRETNKGGEGCPPKAADLQNDIQITFENTLGYQPEKPVKKPSGKKARKAAREAAEAAARAVEAEENEAKNFKPRYKSINYRFLL